MVTRYGSRVAVNGKAILAGDQSFCEGRVLDLSLPGCQIECLHELNAGDYIQLRLFLPDQSAPMNVTLAAVRWVHDTKVGVEFIKSSEEDQVRLSRFVRRYAPMAGRSRKWRDVITLLGAAGD